MADKAVADFDVAEPTDDDFVLGAQPSGTVKKFSVAELRASTLAWGNLTGSLSDQEDLAVALAQKADAADIPTWSTLSGKPASIAAGANGSAAMQAIGFPATNNVVFARGGSGQNAGIAFSETVPAAQSIVRRTPESRVRGATAVDADDLVPLTQVNTLIADSKLPYDQDESSISVLNILDQADRVTVYGLLENLTINPPAEPETSGFVIRLRAQSGQGPFTLTWNADFRFANGLTIPAEVVSDKWIYCGVLYNNYDDKFDVIALQEVDV